MLSFNKDIVFLGIAAETFTDEDKKQQTYYRVSFFDKQAVAPVQLNVMETEDTSPIIDKLVEHELGDSLSVTFTLRPNGKLYQLKLSNVV